ncbi:importin subunit alpha-3-like [Corticium candelabrum]|uniref:importin subunit alpha-3-like n=1 Tax=Corticium candelabrum TaxID=121492 RepID=UPI002E2546E5|nr:importin subunit alpha-3-like [Corticium candelabrum]
MMSQTRMKNFKHKGKDQEEMRRRRTEVTVELRKNKRESSLFKRRNVPSDTEPDEEEDSESRKQLIQQIEFISANIMNEIPATKLAAVRTARKLLSRTPLAPIDQLLECGIVPELVNCLVRDDQPTLQYEACWALTNIASGTSEQTKAVIKCGAVPLLIKLLNSAAKHVAGQALWGLGNVIGDSAECRDYVISHGVIQPLLNSIRAEVSIDYLRNVSWVISNLCRYSNPSPPFHAVCELLPAVCHLILHPDNAVKADTCWAISYLTDSGNDQIQVVIDSGIVCHLVPLLEQDNLKILMPAIRAIGNIVTGTDEQTQTCIDAGCLNQFGRLLMHYKDNIKREATWVLSNITAGNDTQIQAVIDANLIQPLIMVLETGEYKAQKEAVWAVSNITVGGTSEQVGFLVRSGVISPLCRLLAVKDSQIVQVILDALSSTLRMAGPDVQALATMIEEAGALDLIEQLQHHENGEIYKLAYDIIDTYFSQGGDEDEALAPQATDNNFQFSTAAANMPQGGFNF